ncbi:hypothetical protein ATB53_05715 [Xanthomonas translucens]|uniref:Uncharacterized protein n=1 Tax=Xanthomonas campestris pv. translucens TaxID=343 RepID=A0A109HGI1_XANCT|nr:hypothetical protein ATB53_05715 [Xanthomonas translucens]OAX63396.1 hypothetical protein A6R79_05930 [Xanthomonas translucens pv. translucens]
MRIQEAERGFLVAMVGQQGFADAHADRQQHEVVVCDVVLRQVAGRIHHDPDTQLAPSGVAPHQSRPE